MISGKLTIIEGLGIGEDENIVIENSFLSSQSLVPRLGALVRFVGQEILAQKGQG